MRRAVVSLVIIIAAGAIVFLASGALHTMLKGSANTNGEQIDVPVVVSTIAFKDFEEEIAAVGTLNANETILLSPKVPGNVETVLADLGDRVEAGQMVTRLDATNYELAVKQATAAHEVGEAATAQARARFEQVEKEYRRASDLLAENVIPQSRFDAAEGAFKAAREALATAEGQRDQAMVGLEAAEQQLRDTEIRTPVAGVVVARSVEVGLAVAPGAQLFRIVDQSTLKAEVDLPGTDFGRLVPGTSATVTVDAYPGAEFQGSVSVINPMVDQSTRTFRVRVKVPNPTAKLVDGMFARVRFSMETKSLLAVPRDALRQIPGSGTYYAFVVKGNTAHKRTVEIGAMNDHYAEVTAGLLEDDKVVTSGAGRLRSGMRVNVQDVPNKNETDASELTRFHEDRQ
ncbi:MAG: efflux RND transporter periplasmic adaptor subunit [Thermoanaerobaculales bacterium]|nr:efflux RND transporter periplasmic adaptor subunit [Thermoanaerobaculales bacterium]